MDDLKILYVVGRREWREWLKENHKREKGVWLVYYYKASGKPRIPYNDAVEEALCYGWIDSKVKRIDDERYAQKFSPRNPKSRLSEMNRQRVLGLIKLKKMTKAGLVAIAGTPNLGFETAKPLVIHPEILEAIKADEKAWKNFKKLPESYKRLRIAFIESRRRHGVGAFERSLHHFVKMTAKNKKYGFVKEFVG